MSHTPVSTSASRKDDHVRLATEQADTRQAPSDFDAVSFVHHALGAEDVDRVSTEVNVFGSVWAHPMYINAMTGGSEATGRINASLARVARETGIAIASGSMSHLIKDPGSRHTFEVLRIENPDGFVFANLSANATVDDAKTVVDALDANALQIHLNSAQELVMPEGDRTFTHWLRNIERLRDQMTIPVVVKEVGFGLSRETVAALLDIGVTAVDVSGRGGTNFAAIENSRRPAGEYADLAAWGQSTVNCLLDVAPIVRDTPVTVFASGGIRGPMDVVRALSLGATAAGVAGGFLHVLQREGEEALIAEIHRWIEMIRSLQALTGARTPSELQDVAVLLTGSVREFTELRGIDATRYATRGSQRHGSFNA